MERKTIFVSVHLTEQARDELRNAVIAMTSPTGRRLAMSFVLIHALRVALRHQDELVAALNAANDG
jgi:hypothetical protein